ncbi:MAG: hypothetical protein WA005_13930 [Candidatus Binataceae bacterium]
MKLSTLTLVLGFALCVLSSGFLCAETLTGNVGWSYQWGSAWLDLNKPTDFKRGDTIRLKIGGTANKVIVRFLAEGQAPDDPVGIEGGALPIQRGERTVDVTLQEDHLRTTQISVHGGINPWGLYPLGETNGPATILSAERISHQ